MKKNNTIRLQNTLPHLLEAVCSHADCPDWLRGDLWDLINNHDSAVRFDAEFWDWVLKSSEYGKEREIEEAFDEEVHGSPFVKAPLRLVR